MNNEAEKPTIENKIDEAWQELFDFICEENDDLHELVIEYQGESTGKTIRRSWLDRNKILREKEKEYE